MAKKNSADEKSKKREEKSRAKKPKQKKTAKEEKAPGKKPTEIAEKKAEKIKPGGGGKKGALQPLLVGIGASAGGIEAIGQFMDNFDKDRCCILFIIQHQAKETERDILAGLVRRHTKHEVSVAEDGEKYQPGRIYVAPPDKVMGVLDGRIQLSEREKRGASMIIDSFLRSLALEADGRAVAVVLSGSNTDGTLGARAIKEKNGLVIAQDPVSADFATMPQSVIDEGLADLVLKPADMAGHVSDFAEKINKIPPEAWQERETAPPGDRDKLLTLLKNRTGLDFSKYKENTVNRRIKRRMSVHKIDRLKEYLAYVREDHDEALNLFKDLLIGVTNFFRDPDTFDALKKILVRDYLPKLDQKRFRVWVPGCATGEEAYSVAIVVKEALDELEMSLEVDIYATDLDEQSIAQARRGRFPKNIEADVPEERLKRFFIEEDGHYKIKTALREMIIFAVQNVIHDPPFSKLDLACCRNLLMYLKPEAQKRVLAQLRYGLRPGGLLMLGASEGVSAFPDPFDVMSKKYRIFRLKPDMAGSHLPNSSNLPEYRPYKPAGRSRGAEVKTGKIETGFKRAAERFLLQTVPPSVLVNRAGDVLYYFGRTGLYLEPAQGPPRSNILEMARKGLSFDLSTALTTAASKNEVQVRANVRVKTNEHEETIDLYVRPARLEECDGVCFMVSFQKSPERKTAIPGDMNKGYSETARLKIRELEEELRHSREDMQAMIEEYEAANEELKSSNEELQSTNEELKSTNEELETAKEELQSINEEQATLNSELQSKNKELQHVNDDIKNLLSGTRIATLFLDNELRIRRYTQAMDKIMGLRDSDLGRPVGEMKMKLEYKDLEKDAEGVLDDLRVIEREVRSGGGQWYQLRISPYRTTDNVIDGVVATFNDITELKKNERESEAARALAESIVDTVNEPLMVLDQDLNVMSVNKAFVETFQVGKHETVGGKLYDLGDRQWDIPELRKLLEEIVPEKTEIKNYVVEQDLPRIGKKRMHLNARVTPMPEDDKQRILLAVTGIDGPQGTGDQGRKTD